MLALVVSVWVAPVSAQESAGTQSASTGAGGQIVVLDIRGPDGTRQLRDQLDRVLRDAVSGASDYSLVNDAGTTLGDMMVVVGCNSVDASCLTQATEQFGARYLLFGDIVGRGDAQKLSVRLFDAVQGSYLRSFAEPVSALESPFDGFRRQVETLLDPTVDSETLLYVSANVANAAVRIDGREVGATPLRRRGIPPGEYRIVVDHPEYRPWATNIELVEGGDIRLRAPLKPLEMASGAASQAEPSAQDEQPRPTSSASGASDEAAATGATTSSGAAGGTTAAGTETKTTTSESPGRPAVMNWGPWGAMGLGAVGLAGGGLVALQMQQIESDLREWRANNPDRPGCQAEECTLLERGRRAETAHRVMLGVGGVAMTSGLLWLLLRPRAEQSTSGNAGLRLRVAPTAAGVSISGAW
jgi:hypothetical protein